MTEKFVPLDPDPMKRPMGPLRTVLRTTWPPDGETTPTTHSILQAYVWRNYSVEHHAVANAGALPEDVVQGEFGWMDVPREEE